MGPRSWSLMSTAATTSTGAASRRTNGAITRSSVRLANSCVRPSAMCSTPKNGWNPRGTGRRRVWAIPDRPAETCTYRPALISLRTRLFRSADDRPPADITVPVAPTRRATWSVADGGPSSGTSPAATIAGFFSAISPQTRNPNSGCSCNRIATDAASASLPTTSTGSRHLPRSRMARSVPANRRRESATNT